MKKIVGLVFIAACLLSCNKKSGMEGCEDLRTKTVELNKCTEKLTTASVPEICFTDLNDSRCPANANCVWQGVAIAKLTFNANGSSHQLTLATAKHPGFPSTDTSVAGYHIKLLNVTPYPGTGSQEPARAVLQITR